MTTAAHMKPERRSRMYASSSAAALALAKSQRVDGKPNADFSRLFGALGIAVELPVFERRWDYSRLLTDDIHSAAVAAHRLVRPRHQVRIGQPGALERFLERLGNELGRNTGERA